MLLVQWAKRVDAWPEDQPLLRPCLPRLLTIEKKNKDSKNEYDMKTKAHVINFQDGGHSTWYKNSTGVGYDVRACLEF